MANEAALVDNSCNVPITSPTELASVRKISDPTTRPMITEYPIYTINVRKMKILLSNHF